MHLNDTMLRAALDLDAAAPTPLHRQLYEQLRAAILSGQLVAGTRLPGTRTMAVELGISRNTVLNAFDQLFAEGYVEGKTGAGTYVACDLPEAMLQVPADVAQRPAPCGGEHRCLSQRGERIASTHISHMVGEPRPFQTGVPALDAFPRALWAKLTARHWRSTPATLLSYSSPAGYQPLREAIAAYLTSARGVQCTADQVLIVAGSQQAINLTAQLLLDPGDAAWIENPGYCGIRGALGAAGAQLVPVPVDDEGLNVDAGIARYDNARLAYVTPSHQHPTGVVMSLRRRVALLEWAERTQAWILEDDYDSEFRYAGRPLSALQGLDHASRVIYMGTFSKVLLPTLRLGYLVVPPDLFEAFANARTLSDVHSPLIDQAVVTDFINEGHFAQHIRRMRTLYAERQEVLLDAIAQEAGGLIEAHPDESGMTLLGMLPPGVDDEAVVRQAAALGVRVRALSRESLEPLPRGGLILGYGGFNTPTIHEGVRGLAQAVRQVVHEPGVPALDHPHKISTP
jgi:GntR family transcriptional regulator/MocR family aminotransferase